MRGSFDVKNHGSKHSARFIISGWPRFSCLREIWTCEGEHFTTVLLGRYLKFSPRTDIFLEIVREGGQIYHQICQKYLQINPIRFAKVFSTPQNRSHLCCRGGANSYGRLTNRFRVYFISLGYSWRAKKVYFKLYFPNNFIFMGFRKVFYNITLKCSHVLIVTTKKVLIIHSQYSNILGRTMFLLSY